MTGYILGIDPGKTGGILAMDSRGDIMAMHPDPVAQTLLKVIAEFKPSHVFLEKAQAMPKNGAVSMFNYGQGFGEYIGVLIALQVPFTLIPPAMWAKRAFIGVPASLKGKDRAALAVSRKWPCIDFRASPKCKKPHEGLVDAALIADYGLRLFLGQFSS